MSSIPLTTQDPGPFTYVEGQTYYNELLAHEILRHAAVMAEDGYEIQYDVVDEATWTLQSSTLTNQANIVFALASDDDMPAAWSSRLLDIGNILATLLSLSMSLANYTVRATMIPLIEGVIASAGGQSSNPGEELVAVLKAALVEESVPGSGVYLSTQLKKLGDILQAIQDLKYNSEVLDIPATPRPIRVHLQGKTIQQ